MIQLGQASKSLSSTKSWSQCVVLGCVKRDSPTGKDMDELGSEWNRTLYTWEIIPLITSEPLWNSEELGGLDFVLVAVWKIPLRCSSLQQEKLFPIWMLNLKALYLEPVPAGRTTSPEDQPELGCWGASGQSCPWSAPAQLLPRAAGTEQGLSVLPVPFGHGECWQLCRGRKMEFLIWSRGVCSRWSYRDRVTW